VALPALLTDLYELTMLAGYFEQGMHETPATFDLLFREARLGLLAALMAGFGAAISEVGATIMVGGNIKGSTRTLTSATVQKVSQGDFETAFALSFILLALIYAVTLTLTVAQQRRPPA